MSFLQPLPFPLNLQHGFCSESEKPGGNRVDVNYVDPFKLLRFYLKGIVNICKSIIYILGEFTEQEGAELRRRFGNVRR